MENFYLLLFSILFTATVGFIGYFLKSVHAEIKQLIKELTDYTTKLKELIVGIQFQIEKTIEIDIKSLKGELKELQDQVEENYRKLQNYLKD